MRPPDNLCRNDSWVFCIFTYTYINDNMVHKDMLTTLTVQLRNLVINISSISIRGTFSF